MSNQPTYKGDLEGFPAEVVEKMLERQFEQTGKRDVSVFEKTNIVNELGGGFDWESTIEHCDFWDEVICDKNFDLFFERYPKTETQPESADLHQQIADLQSRLDLAVKELEELKAKQPKIIMEVDGKTIATFFGEATLTQIKGGADENR